MKKLFRIALFVLILPCCASAKVVDRVVAQVNNEIITLSELNRGVAMLREELSAKYSGEELQQALAKAEKDVLEELIRQKLLLQKAQELGFGANIDAQVSAAVEKIRVDNKFSNTQEFEKALAQQGMDMAGFRDQLKKSMITRSLVDEFVGSRITVLSQEIEKYYTDHSPEFTTPEEVSLSEIILPVSDNDADARIQEVYKRIKEGESFAALATQYSKGATASKGGNIGSYLTAKLNQDIANAIANVKDGEVAAIQKTKDSYVIYRVDSRKPATKRPIAEVRDDIRNRLFQQKFEPEYDRFIQQLREDAYIQIFPEIKQ
jgi:peptidyl-prolyl cis-trans isomerase SurA